MKFEHEYHSVPREEKLLWGNGAWVDEPDKAQWRDEATGLPCLLVRNQLGALCGYVGVYPDHPYFAKQERMCTEAECLERVRQEIEAGRAELATLAEEDAKWRVMSLNMSEMMLKRGHARCENPKHAVSDYALDVHGGITFSDFCHTEGDESKSICHIERPDEPRVWWLGFDCAHAWDVTPQMNYKTRQIMGEDQPGYLSANERDPMAQYRDVSFVVHECTSLAAQLYVLGGNDGLHTL